MSTIHGPALTHDGLQAVYAVTPPYSMDPTSSSLNGVKYMGSAASIGDAVFLEHSLILVSISDDLDSQRGDTYQGLYIRY